MPDDPLSNLPPPPASYRREKREKKGPTRKGPIEAAAPPLPTALVEALQKAEQVAREAIRIQADLKSEVVFPASVADRMRALLAERAKRRLDGLSLYEPLPVQAAFHESPTTVRLLRGSNRGGKTLPAAIEVARAVTGNDPFFKYRPRDGRVFLVGKDLAHIGQVMYRKLFRAGAFKMIRDQLTGSWRAFRPWDANDLVRVRESKDAPPLIPARLVKSIAWHSKAENQPSLVCLKNGWELSFYSSLGKPPQGSDTDLVWFDEEIVDPEWFPEMAARILDRQGRIIWSATPQAGTDQLYDLHERAEEEARSEKRGVEEYIILLANNPHIREEDKETLAANLSDEERKVRVDGDFALLSYKMYPEFDMRVHGVEHFQVPDTWARYLIIDPGHQVCAVLFAAVPPPDHRDHVYLYDELYLKECDATRFAQAVSEKVRGQFLQAFVIDPNMAIYTEVGAGKRVDQQYSDALRKVGVASAATGTGFILASEDLDAGPLAVHEWLRLGENYKPKLQVLKGKLPNFEWEIRRYHRKRVGGMVTDRPDNKRHNHLMDCLRYLALYDPRYVKPGKSSTRTQGAALALKKKQERMRQKQGGAAIRLGPGGKR